MKYVAGTRPSAPPASPEELGQFDVQDLLDKCHLILQREIRNLLIESSAKKLSEESSAELVRYIKLLQELKVDWLDYLKSLTPEQLREINKK